MRSGRTTYLPGQGTAVAGPGGFGLLAGADLGQIVDAVLEGAGMAPVVDVLMARGPLALPIFAFAFFEGDDVRLLIRGGAVAVADGDRHDDGRSTIWRELVVPAPAVLSLRLGPEPPAHQASFALVAGAAPAGMIEHRRDGAAPSPHTRHEPEPEPQPELRAVAVVADTGPPEPEHDFGHLLGSTRYQSVEDGAVRPASARFTGNGNQEGEGAVDATMPPPASADQSITPITETFLTTPPPTLTPERLTVESTVPEDDPLPAAPPAVAPAAPVPVTVPPRPGLIDTVPGMASAPAAAAPAPPPPPPPPPAPPGHAPPGPDRPAGDAAAAGVPGAAGAPGDGPTVQAVHCPGGHPNPPYGNPCRRCGAAITDRTVTVIPRPELGLLRFDDGTTIALDAPLVIGRKPPEDAVVSGEPARPVQLPDPDMVLSRLHAEVHLADWQVQIVDRDSMNHTFVTVPGDAPVQLRPAEPFPIPLGTVVALGDAVRFTYDVERR